MSGPAAMLRGQPDLFKLWAGQSVSAFGSQITLLALPVLAVGWIVHSPVRTRSDQTGRLAQEAAPAS